ncbi:PEP/pyruvate-binding domain-containing protein [Desulfopila inferna]|uniref:PEP/pyruvate-binding domain-containing protein n=1 Tax=Desulfopila inferna TaxID=468528 RepID=UPI0019660F70|nr:PEP/pyruvate-binding domain-containing protein [Desulfopila inferna]MBM9603061.1 pyruvate, water dikinase [Desulfopila inferna]
MKLKVVSYFKKLLSPTQLTPQDQEQLNIAFIQRYRHFRSLLTANNNALQAMADLEKLYYSGESYRMAAVRSKITTILVNVFKMIRNLVEMSNGRYRTLETIFEKIGDDIDQIIERKPTFRKGPFIIPLNQVRTSTREQTGDKMAHLGEISRLPSIHVPQGFVITASATRHFLPPEHITEINRRLQILEPDDHDGLYKTCAELQKIVLETPLPGDLEELLQHHYALLEKTASPGCLVALRSSALGEDTIGVTFAGLYRTALNVDKSHLGEAYKQVIASKYGPKAIAYRRRRGFRHQDIEMCVGCLVMIDASVSGVTYTSYPWENGETTVRIVAAPGIAKGVVDGTTPSDLFLVSREHPHPVICSETRQKQQEEGKFLSDVPLLSREQLIKITETALLLEYYFEQPQDIEWSLDHRGKLYILQSRPLAAQKEKVVEEDIPNKTIIPVTNNTPFFHGGLCASEGIACGKIYKVDSPEEMSRFPKGAVLMVEYPVPDWAPLLNLATAVLASSGTEAGHLATVAREFGIPALFSLPDIVQTLENGTLITVDSTERTIYRGCIEDLISRKKPKKDIMAGSPVQRILTEALQHITPLNLTDPASLNFKASMCQTLHDITRYCHEKSVSEMFKFGETYKFDKGMAKRLVAQVPLEWWVINLADGFREGIDDSQKAVHIDDIVSEPMLAIWQGISAFPWLGPPALSTRGFGSIILQSAMRPDLEPAMASRLTIKNYFLISKHFCNFNVRLGYHYAMIESYLSDLLTESYITFRFKGGAADLRRKTVRARLLADILKEFDFRVELRSDTLLARIKKKPKDFLIKRLQILGYLTQHTRQLDMVMNRKNAVEHYKEKFLDDINIMLSSIPPFSEEA